VVVQKSQIPDGASRSQARKVVRLIASRQRASAAAIARRIFTALTTEVPEYAAIADEGLAEDVRRVSTAGVLLWLNLLGTGRTPQGDDLDAVREGARRRARQGFDHYALLRAWRIAIRVMWSELIQDPEAQDPLVRQVLPDFAEEAMNYSDQVSLAVTDAYLEEASLVARENERQRSALLELILSHPEEALGVARPPELDRPHMVLVAETADLPLEQLDRIGEHLERRAGAAFWTVRSQAVVAVVPLARAGDRPRVVRHLGEVFRSLGAVDRIGVGGEASSVDETRQSYLEAVEAVNLGPQLNAQGGPVFDYADVGTYSMMAVDRARAQRFVEASLAPLKGLRPWAEPTVEAYLARQGRIKETARELGVHPNTVKYRLGRLRAPLAGMLQDPARATELLLALRLKRLLVTG
jgi:DNA-binding PucR family transcriptional regulator